MSARGKEVKWEDGGDEEWRKNKVIKQVSVLCKESSESAEDSSSSPGYTAEQRRWTHTEGGHTNTHTPFSSDRSLHWALTRGGRRVWSGYTEKKCLKMTSFEGPAGGDFTGPEEGNSSYETEHFFNSIADYKCFRNSLISSTNHPSSVTLPPENTTAQASKLHQRFVRPFSPRRNWNLSRCLLSFEKKKKSLISLNLTWQVSLNRNLMLSFHLESSFRCLRKSVIQV